MKRTAAVFLNIFMLAFLCSGCLVAESKYLKKADEADQMTKQAAALETVNKNLKEQIKSLTGQNEDLTGAVAILEAENNKLKQNVSQVTKKTQEVEKASNTYRELLNEMKGEIAQGQITIKELKGKLTMDVVDKILFDSGEAKVKKEGIEVLSRVVEILKTVKDKNIRIEGHTDNVRITSKLARVYPTNWELAAARAINVSKYLQQQGIDPTILSATAFGEYQPVADNTTPEGRAKNRRIAIILLPKD
ncbi:MAG: chemotaxis protein MotB [Deltaproteobacteria bacterium HGW-Deltaproteobacteria-6]|jgi:chemotaxis protein MotB|nr:MAG: chemotaxis protein MotB [Deltaproteobacteria bacterium HGW-Deltaproteobacteria-6]